jgi:ribosomal protein S18 acetylase RimI-like enzyme
MRITQTRAPADVDAAAQLWAEATAARDGEDEVAGLTESRPIIQGVLDRSADSFVLLGTFGRGMPGAFAAVAPIRERVAELVYFGVSPHLLGLGAGRELLGELQTRLQALGYDRAELSVYTDNVRAIRLYERLGWRAYGDPVPHRRTGRPEQRYRLSLGTRGMRQKPVN